MNIYNDKKEFIGQILFGLSILMLIYMLFTPLTQVISNINEYFTLTLINFPVGDILTIVGGDVNPPLYYLILKGFYKIFNNFYMLKVFSILPYAILLILATTKLKDDYGWFTAGLFVFSISFMSEFFIKFLLLRPYGWAMLFCLLAFIYLKDLLVENPNEKSYILFTVFSILASYFHYYALISVICMYLILFANSIKFHKDSIKYITYSFIAFIICYLPWIPTLMNLITSINNGLNISTITFDSIIQSFGYFAYSGDTIFSAISIIILILLCLFYLKNEKDKYIIAGLSIYTGSIVLILILSVILKPILIVNSLLPIAGILWFVISIMINRINDKRMFLISIILIALLFVSGFSTMVSNNSVLYENSAHQKETLENIVTDSNSITVITSPKLIMYFLDYSKDGDIYCVDVDYAYGENMNRTHSIYNFKDINLNEIESLAKNNPDSNIYLVSWGKPEVNIPSSEVLNDNGLIISKVNI